MIAGIIACVVYGLLLWRRGIWHWAYALLFVGGVLLVFVALFSPLDAVGGCCLLTAHMAQHVLLIQAAPALLAWAGRYAVRPGPARWPHLAMGEKGLMVVSTLLLLVTMYLWHWPVLYQAALRSPEVHEFEHMLYLGTGLLFWWSIIDRLPPAEEATRWAGPRLLTLLASSLGMMPIGLILLTAGHPIYSFYVEGAERLGWSALYDQQIASLVMMMAGGAALVAPLTIGFALLMGGFGRQAQTVADQRFVEPPL